MTWLFVIALVAQAQPPQTYSDTLTVTATKTPARLGETAASVVVLSRETLETTAAATADDALRQVPGFALFRRSGSRVANPTAQGVSLRGVGASGASRALVLDDGIPLNDPFGGWVYWGRVPRAAIDRIEVVRGGASDLYGSGALSGVVHFLRKPSNEPSVAIDASGGSDETATASLFAAGRSGAWSGSVAAGWFTTTGYVLVDRSRRGAVDRPADSEHVALDATVDREVRIGGRTFLRLSRFEESRNNGTPLQVNDTETTQAAFGSDVPVSGGMLQARLFATQQDYRQTFSAVAANRNSERLTVDQSVPSRSAGGSLQWHRAAGRSHALLLGVEGMRVSGSSEELQFAPNGSRTFAETGGRQTTGAVFVRDLVALTADTSLAASIRLDTWRSTAADARGAVSPRLAVVHRANGFVTLTASAYRAFRAPTLNELYRGFRVGNVVTRANDQLGAERLTAFESGVRFESAARRASARATLFWMKTADAIANVTLSTTPSLITRQRQNVGSSRSAGAEIEGELRPREEWRISAGYLFSDARVTAGSLDGRRLPQVPRHQASLQASWTRGRATAALQGRWSGRQFDDDLNQLPLRGFTAADLFASWRLTRSVQLTLAGENIFDERVEVSATPVITLGPPRSWRIGVQFRN